MGDVFTKVKHTDYLKLIKHCEALETENAQLRAELKKATVKAEKTEKNETKIETKKGGNK